MKVFALRHFCLAIGAAFCGPAILAPTQASALELFGIKIFGRDKADEAEETIGEPQRLHGRICRHQRESGHREGAERRIQPLADRKEPASGSAGLLAKARGTISGCWRRFMGLAAMAARSASWSTAGRQQTFHRTRLPDPASVSIAINPGPVFLFDKASIINQALRPAHRRDRVPLPQDEGFERGHVARSGVILQAENLAVEAWRHQGYAKAKVANRSVTADHGPNTVDAEIDIEPGRKAYYDGVAVQGTERMDPAFVAWMTGLKPGQEYDPTIWSAQTGGCRSSTCFVPCAFRRRTRSAKMAGCPLPWWFRSASLRRFGVGGSYSTLDGLGLEAYWLHRNLFGKGEKLRFDAKVAGIDNNMGLRDDELTYRLGATFIKPGVYTPDTDFVASVFGGREVLDTYTRTGVSASSASITYSPRSFRDGCSSMASMRSSRMTLSASRDFTTVSTLGGLTFDNRDSKTDPTEGYYAEGVAEPFYEFNYGNAWRRASPPRDGLITALEKKTAWYSPAASNSARWSAQRFPKPRPTNCFSQAAAVRCAATPIAASAW